MNCRDCHRYDLESRTCRDNKINPQSYEQACEAVSVFGVRSVCIYNDYRERLIEVRQAIPNRVQGVKRSR